MKLNLLTSLMAAGALALGTLTISSQPGSAQTQKFFCGMSREGGPATFVSTTRWGNFPLIRWVDSSFPPPWTPERRCEEISRRFQKFYEQGTLDYLKADRSGGQPVLCVAAFKGGDCLRDGVLVTLKPGTDPRTILRQLIDSQALATRGPVYLSGDSPFSEVNGEGYFDIKGFLGEREDLPDPSDMPNDPPWKQP